LALLRATGWFTIGYFYPPGNNSIGP